MKKKGLGFAYSVFLFLLIAVWIISACSQVQIRTRKGVYHTVQKGETLWSICDTYQVSMKPVCRSNRIRDPKHLVPGQKLFIPGADRVLSVPESSKKKVADGRQRSVKPADGRSSPQPRPQASSTSGAKELDLLWPVKGVVTSWFGVRNGERHNGLDIAAAKGTAIRAAEQGKVIYSDNGIKSFGNMIIIKHKKGISTVYAHNSKNLVEVDQSVKRGQIIGKVGSTGRSKGNHLHFEVRQGAQAVNPVNFLP